MSIDNKFYNLATGEVADNPTAGLTYEQRQALRKAQDLAAEMIKADIAERTKKVETHDQQVLRTHQERIATLKSTRASATPAEKAAIDRRLAMLKVDVESLDKKMSEEARRETLANSHAAKLARDSADVLERSWKTLYPFADEIEVQTAIEIARSNDWDTAEGLNKAHFGLLEKISEKNLAAELQRAQEASLVLQKAEMDSAKADLRVAENKQRLGQIRGGPDA